MSSNEKVFNALGERKEAMGTMLLVEKKSLTKDSEKVTDKLVDKLFSEKKSSTLDVDKGTDELKFMKQKLNKIFKKDLNQFEGQSTGTQGWFKLNIKFFETTYSEINS